MDIIEHRDPAIRIHTQQVDTNGDVSVDRRLTIGGDPIQVMLLGRSRMVTARWDNDELVLVTRSDFSGNSRVIEDRWRMAADGESIAIARRHELPGGAVRQQLLMRRVDPA